MPMQRMGNCVLRRRAAVVQPKAREPRLAGFLENNAGSDLLSHTPPPRVRGGAEKIAHAARGKLCAPVLPA